MGMLFKKRPMNLVKLHIQDHLLFAVLSELGGEDGHLFQYQLLTEYHSPSDAVLVHGVVPDSVQRLSWVFRQRDTYLQCKPRTFAA